ncbi:MAG: peptidylprolyl isomerase [Porticoccaceae bacterium]|nr:peptidylprolyl isomerase [Porticoccaceae bacterium]
MKKIFREPLFQFLLVALVLLGGERLINAEAYSDQQYQIVVDDQLLLQFMQLRAKTFKPEKAMAALKAMSAEDRQQLIDDYAREEALFREAMALNLDKNDQVIRRRLVQKMDYLAQGFFDEIGPLTEEDLRAYYAEQRQDYKEAASATFTHVFISSAARSSEEAEAMAEVLIKKLNAEQVPFEKALGHGERFLYHRNYVNRDDDEIGSHFGDGFREQLFNYQVSEQWQGPLQSDYGWHLVLLVKNTDSYIPEFEEVASAVFADAQRQQQREIKRQTIDELISKYKVSDQSQQ